MTPLLILNYHRITRPGEHVDPRYRNFTLDESIFRSQLETIRDLGIPVIHLHHYSVPLDTGHPLRIAITFDDGHLSDLTIAAPILSEFGFPAAFFPVVAHIGQPGYMDWEQLKTLKKSGFKVGSHSRTHAILTRLDPAALEQEIRQAKLQLDEGLDSEVTLFSIPYGRYSPAVLEAICDAGHLYALSTDAGINRKEAFLLKRWNIKASTTSELFRSILSGDRKFRHYRRMTASVRSMLYRINDTFHKR